MYILDIEVFREFLHSHSVNAHVEVDSNTGHVTLEDDEFEWLVSKWVEPNDLID